MSLSVTLNTALTGLQTQQAGLQVVSNNIANATTEGYTRKTAETASRVIEGLGVGVELGTLRRTVDNTLLREIRDAMSLVGAEQVAKPYFDQLQDLFGSPGANSSISASLTDLATALDALSATPEGPTQRIEVINAALKIVRELDVMANQVQTLRSDAERQLTGTIDEINNQLQIIADLNTDIKHRLAVDSQAVELEDKRDMALNKLAGYIDIQTFTRSSGEVVIFTDQGTLLDNFPNFLSHTEAPILSASSSYPTGVDGISLNNRDITNNISGGELKGLIDLRDNVLPGLQAELDQLAAVLRDEINALHNKGAGFPPPTELTGTRLFDSANDEITVSGTIRLAVVTEDGRAPDNLATAVPFAIDLGGLTAPVTVQDVVDAINTQAAASPPQVIQAQLVTEGSQVRLQISTLNPNHRLVLDEGDTAVSAFRPTAGTSQAVQLQNGSAPGFSHFFGLNDFFTSTGFDTGDPAIAGLTRTLAVRQDLVDDPTRLARASSAFTLPLSGGDSVIAAGDNSIVQSLAAKFDEPLSFAAAGNLSATTTTLAGYGAEIIFENATAAVRSENNLAIQVSLQSELTFRSESLSGVNLDEELANMIVIQQAYSSSARLVSTVQELFNILQQMAR